MYIIYVNNTLPLAHEISRHFWAAKRKRQQNLAKQNQPSESEIFLSNLPGITSFNFLQSYKVEGSKKPQKGR